MKTKLFTLFVALLATTSLWAQTFKVGDLYYEVTSRVAPYTVRVIDCDPNIVSVEIPSTISCPRQFVESPGEGKVTILVQVPEPLYEGSFVVIIGSLTSWVGQSTQLVEGTETWYAGTFDWNPGSTFMVAHGKNDGIFDWGSVVKNYTLIEGDVTLAKAGDSSGDVINTDNQIIVISVESWYMSACDETNDSKAFNDGLYLNRRQDTFFETNKNETSCAVTSIGNYAFNNCSSLTSVTIPNSVTSIGNSAFTGCSSLTSIIIPNSVTSIGNSPFEYCSSLTSIVVEAGNTTYDSRENCNAIIETASNTLIAGCQKTTIPNSVTSIGDYAFRGCSSLTSVTIPNSVTSIGEGAFHGCSGLTSITIPNSVTSIGDYAFYDCSNITSVEWNAKNCQNFSNSLSAPFYSARTQITSFIIGDSVQHIPSYLCYEMDNLTSLTIPNAVTSIGDYAFRGCSSLTSVTIPNSVTSIGDDAFRGCSSLTSVTIPNSVTSIGGYAFYGCSSLTSVTIPNSVTSIGEGAFRGCSGLTSITIPNSVTSIGDDAFYYCSSLTSVTIPNSVTSIGRRAFCSCEKLGTLVLGDKVKSIGYEAFYGCNKLYHIYCYAPEPPVIEEEVFTNYNVNLYVPCNYLDNYKYDRVFGSFRYIQCIDSEDVTTNDVVVTPGVNDVTITWPTEDGADTYSIVIKKGNDVFCTLTFNAEGQLLNIAFAPGRYGNHPAQYAEQAGKGYRFTVTSLESGTKYGYNIEVKDASNKTIKSHSGEFTTQSTTAVDNITTNNANIQKIMRDGQFIIVRDGVEYNAVGQEM